MEKEFVSYELALKLKELGFDEACFGFYRQNKSMQLLDSMNPINWNKLMIKHGFIHAPLWQQAFDWFREKYDIHFYIDRSYGLGKFEYEYHVEDYGGLYMLSSHEEARLVCLEKLIKIIESND